jgi:hypothetical protein
MLLGSPAATLEHWRAFRCGQQGSAVKKTVYAISLVLLLGALIVQSVWGANLP